VIIFTTNIKENIGMSKEELQKWTVTELCGYCGIRKIKYHVGKKRFTKKELIDAILGKDNY